MTWQTGVAADYLDAVDQLIEVATGTHVSAIAIAAAGTGYAVGDIERIDGGTTPGGHAAAVEVLLVDGGGGVLFARVARGGAYSSAPGSGATTANEGTTADPAVPGSGTGLVVNATATATGWAVLRDITDIGLTQAVVDTGGTGYSVDDVLTVVGGTGTAATVRVTSAPGGVVGAVSVETPGQYTVAPAAGALATTGGSGTGCTVTGTFHGEVDRRQVILNGPGSGANEVYVGIFTFDNVPTDATNWELAGFTGYDPSLEWHEQPGKSRGEYGPNKSNPGDTGGSYTLLSRSAMPWWLGVNDRRIMFEFNPGTTYSSGYIGWGSPFATEGELPNPMLVAGQTSSPTLRFSSGSISNSSISDPISIASGRVGPVQWRDSAGVWHPIQNSQIVSSSREELHVNTLYPTGQAVGSSPSDDPVAEGDKYVVTGPVDFADLIPNSGIPGSPQARLLPSPNSGGNLPIPWQIQVMQSDPSTNALAGVMEMDGVFFVMAEEGIVAEDTLLDQVGARYRIFQNGTRSDIWAFMAMKEE